MAPRLNLKSEEPQRSPEREQFALAAGRHVGLTRHLAAFKTALAKVWGDIQNVKSEISTFEKEVAQAKAAGTSHRVAEALGKESPAPSPVSDARAKLFDARERFGELDQAQTRLMLDEAEISSQLEISGIHLRECVSAVVRSDPATTDLVKQLEIARSRFVSLNSCVEYLAYQNMIPAQSPHAIPATMDVENAWRKSVAELMARNVDAVLPTVDEER